MATALLSRTDEKATLTGLTEKEAEIRLKADGENVLAHKKGANPVAIFFGQFRDVMIMILLVCTVISVVMGEIYDAVTIIVIVLLNALLGFIQEYRTEKTIEALRKIAVPTARVIRGGKAREIEAAKLVRGDIFLLEAGDKIPCDGKILSSSAFECDESMLTGESVPVAKSACGADNNALNQTGAVYMGTVVTKGSAVAEAIATGKSTQMGLVSGMLTEIEPEKTPLQKRLAELGKLIAISCTVICALVALIGVLRGNELIDMLFIGISLAVAAIPEGLPATVTIALALAVRRIYKQKALMNKLHAVETLGCANVICSDKTGTLTQNKMTVCELYADFSLFMPEQKALNPTVRKLLLCGVLCNNARLSQNGFVGDPTEGALLVCAKNLGITESGYRRVSEIPFDSAIRFMEVKVSSDAGTTESFLKGAADTVIERCGAVMVNSMIKPFSQLQRRKVLSACSQMGAKGLRVLGFACKCGGEWVFLGLMGMEDPLRPEIIPAVKKCRKAGIKVVMITGDHLNTAVHIAKKAGIMTEKSTAFTGAEIAAMSETELAAATKTAAVFARVSPADKLRLVRAYKAAGNIVAMTGDGVNDAPAVKEASIGVSMGITGTDVTKEAAQVVLLDDNFATLVSAVEQGRTIYTNIRRFVRYMLSCNIGEVVTMLVAMVFGMPVVLVPIQILLVNLVTDGLPAVALSLEPPSDNVMSLPPRAPATSIFAGGMLFRILSRGAIIGLITLLSFVLVNSENGLEAGRTAALCTLSVSQLVFVFECKDERRGIFNAFYMGNPKLILAVIISLAVIVAGIYLPVAAAIFQCTALSAKALFIAMGLAALPSVLSGIVKLVYKEY